MVNDTFFFFNSFTVTEHLILSIVKIDYLLWALLWAQLIRP